jgi:hypothetical protein
VVILHAVKDYAVWHRAFTAAAGLRQAAGETRYEVLRAADHPALVVHFSARTSHATARRFFECPRVAQIRREAGVSSPRFLSLPTVETGTR